MLPAFECDKCGRVVFATVIDRILGSSCSPQGGCPGRFYRAFDRDLPARPDRIRDRARSLEI